MKRSSLILVLFLAVLSRPFAQETEADVGGHPSSPHQPPAEGQMIRGHWTPYDPPDPDLFPEESRLHIMQGGDTLWNLAGQFMSNPWLWPQLWDQNRYILDSHWIYPGDPLLIPPPPTVVGGPTGDPTGGSGDAGDGSDAGFGGGEATDSVAQGQPEEPTGPVEVRPILEPDASASADAAMTPLLLGPELLPVVNESDLYCARYLVPQLQDPGLQVAEKEEEGKQQLSQFDVIYLNQGLNDGIQAGAVYSVLRPGSAVKHPATQDVVGSVVSQIGRVRVLAVQEHTATAWFVSSCGPSVRGDWLVPFEEIAVPLTAHFGDNVSAARYELELEKEDPAFIVYSPLDKILVADGDVVEVDLGEAEVNPGDFLWIYRDYKRKHSYYSTESYIQPGRPGELLNPDNPYPPIVLGRLVVFRTGEGTSSAKIVNAFREIQVGDKVTIR